MPALQLQISEADLERLSYERYAYPQPMVQKRLFAVYLKATTTLPNTSIACLVGLHPNTVATWIKVYRQQGYKALLSNKYRGAESLLEQHSHSILASFQQQPPHSSREAAGRIKDLCGIERSHEQVRAFMKRQGLHFLRCGHVPAKADPEGQRQWMEQELQPVIRQAQSGKQYLLFLDAAHFMLQPFLCCLWCVARLFVRAASGRNRINVLGAVEAISKKVVTLTNTTYINAEVLTGFLKKLKQHFCDKPIVIVLDNVRYQHCHIVEQAAAALGIRLLFLPPYSPNLNVIERLWRFAKKKILYGRYYESAQKFHNAIEEFFRTVNKKHKKELHSLLTLNFQIFDLKNSQICPL